MMIGNKCVVDTSIIINFFRNNNDVATILDSLQEVFVPATVVVELKYGAYKSKSPGRHLS